MSKEKAAKITADWWAEKWIPDDTRELFRSAVEKRTLEALNDPEQLTGGAAFLHVDYDPDGLLLDIIRSIGIECSGRFFSARGLLPEKHHTYVYSDHIEPKEGYGNWTRTIVVED